MPLYEFQCDTCEVFEAWRTIDQRDESPSCPTCEGKTKRIFSVPNFNLNSGAVFLKAKQTEEPKLVKREREIPKPRYKTHQGGRPWMMGH